MPSLFGYSLPRRQILLHQTVSSRPSRNRNTPTASATPESRTQTAQSAFTRFSLPSVSEVGSGIGRLWTRARASVSPTQIRADRRIALQNLEVQGGPPDQRPFKRFQFKKREKWALGGVGTLLVSTLAGIGTLSLHKNCNNPKEALAVLHPKGYHFCPSHVLQKDGGGIVSMNSIGQMSDYPVAFPLSELPKDDIEDLYYSDRLAYPKTTPDGSVSIISDNAFEPYGPPLGLAKGSNIYSSADCSHANVNWDNYFWSNNLEVNFNDSNYTPEKNIQNGKVFAGKDQKTELGSITTFDTSTPESEVNLLAYFLKNK